MYFNDETYVGYVPGGIIEIATVDADMGTVFYSIDNSTAARLDREAKQAPAIVPETDDCIDCHGGGRQDSVPRLFVRSVFTDDDGFPMLPFGTFNTTASSPLSERWGGWYVTGSTGSQKTMGNTRFKRGDPRDPQPLDDTKFQIKSLSEVIEVTPYPSEQSDVVALMVFEHQTEMHNRINRAAHGVKWALRDEKIINDALGETPTRHSDSTLRRIASNCEPLVKHLLFSEEFALQAPVEGDPAFQSAFLAQAKVDSKGRSLSDFDLKSRLFKHPCSYLIYAPSFEALPPAAKDYVYKRLVEILKGSDKSKAFAHLSPADRNSIAEILCDTKPEFKVAWNAGSKLLSSRQQ